MKNILICLALLFLTSCAIQVDDFGTSWDKGTVDPALLGTWKGAQKYHDETHMMLLLTDADGTYRIDSLNKKDRTQKDYASLPARTLTAGPYKFFMMDIGDHGRRERYLVRYSLQGRDLIEYNLEVKPMETWMSWRHPQAKNIKAVVCHPKCKFDSVRIQTLNDEVVKVLAGIPDTPEYWTPFDLWRKDKR